MRVRHREELETLERKISEFSASENRAIDEIATSRFAHPVLFISHRWEGTERPDPAGHQLEKLRALKDCFIIYDYTSFPQKPMSESEAGDLEEEKIVLNDMGELIRNVVVMDHPDYTRSAAGASMNISPGVSRAPLSATRSRSAIRGAEGLDGIKRAHFSETCFETARRR